ncbi:MAG: hypothetical protein E7352_03960 [Clostridiales bacterium]|nr:hypothetical protein [Clostridiales bacterium]
MNKKNFKKTAAILLGLALTVGATGCNFIETDTSRDLGLSVATVNISAELKDDARYGEEVATAVNEIVGTSSISKRDLITYFLNAGSSYAETYGYAATFNMLLDNLINREIMIQYAVAYYLAKDEFTLEKHDAYVEAQLNDASVEEKELLEAHPQVLSFKYFLTEGDNTKMEDYNRAVYGLKKMLNTTLDNLETQYIKAEEHDHGDTSKTRTMPTGVGAEKTDYCPAKYEIYTGRNSLSECGAYEKQDGSTTLSRKKAYNAFLTSLYSYGLISSVGGKIEDPSDIEHLNYYYVELESSLSQALISKYYEDLEADVEKELNKENEQGKAYAEVQFDEMLASQQKAYENKPSAFKTAMDGVSESSFVLYGIENFGFVYNILIPLSTKQSVEYKMYQAQGLTANELFLKRKALWSEIKAEDQRSSWISDDEHTNYSYEGEDGKYYFFEDHFSEEKADQYETITHYAGQYPFQGTIDRDEDGNIEKIDVKTNSKGVDEVLNDMFGLIGLDRGEDNAIYNAYTDMTTYTTDAKKDVDGNEVKDENGDVIYVDDDVVEDYSKFIYRRGQVQFNGTPIADDFFLPTSESYKALSAVNEILFAYSTDPGSLNSYMGYVVSPYGNGYVPEFEAAAQWAVEKGVGSWAVVPTDYGWHIIYCSFKYEGGKVYDYNHVEAVGDSENGIEAVEGSFSKMFYDNLKAKTLSNVTSELEKLALNQFNNDKVVQKFPSVYQDLLSM